MALQGESNIFQVPECFIKENLGMLLGMIKEMAYAFANKKINIAF